MIPRESFIWKIRVVTSRKKRTLASYLLYTANLVRVNFFFFRYNFRTSLPIIDSDGYSGFDSHIDEKIRDAHTHAHTHKLCENHSLHIP
jgi:hypothetical protein